jgi:hypothetical protein
MWPPRSNAVRRQTFSGSSRPCCVAGASKRAIFGAKMKRERILIAFLKTYPNHLANGAQRLALKVRTSLMRIIVTFIVSSITLEAVVESQ